MHNIRLFFVFFAALLIAGPVYARHIQHAGANSTANTKISTTVSSTGKTTTTSNESMEDDIVADLSIDDQNAETDSGDDDLWADPNVEVQEVAPLDDDEDLVGQIFNETGADASASSSDDGTEDDLDIFGTEDDSTSTSTNNIVLSKTPEGQIVALTDASEDLVETTSQSGDDAESGDDVTDIFNVAENETSSNSNKISKSSSTQGAKSKTVSTITNPTKDQTAAKKPSTTSKQGNGSSFVAVETNQKNYVDDEDTVTICKKVKKSQLNNKQQQALKVLESIVDDEDLLAGEADILEQLNEEKYALGANIPEEEGDDLDFLNGEDLQGGEEDDDILDDIVGEEESAIEDNDESDGLVDDIFDIDGEEEDPLEDIVDEENTEEQNAPEIANGFISSSQQDGTDDDLFNAIDEADAEADTEADAEADTEADGEIDILGEDGTEVTDEQNAPEIANGFMNSNQQESTDDDLLNIIDEADAEAEADDESDIFGEDDTEVTDEQNAPETANTFVNSNEQDNTDEDLLNIIDENNADDASAVADEENTDELDGVLQDIEPGEQIELEDGATTADNVAASTSTSDSSSDEENADILGLQNGEEEDNSEETDNGLTEDATSAESLEVVEDVAAPIETEEGVESVTTTQFVDEVVAPSIQGETTTTTTTTSQTSDDLDEEDEEVVAPIVGSVNTSTSTTTTTTTSSSGNTGGSSSISISSNNNLAAKHLRKN